MIAFFLVALKKTVDLSWLMMMMEKVVVVVGVE